MLTQFAHENMPRHMLGQGAPELPPIIQLPAEDVGGNPITAIINPITLQLIAAFRRGQVRHAGRDIAMHVVARAVVESDLIAQLTQLVVDGADDLAAQVGNYMADFVVRLVDGTAVVEENTMLTNERLLLVQNPEGTKSYAILQNGRGQTEPVPAIRLPQEEWNQMHRRMADQLNITPATQPPVQGDFEFKDELIPREVVPNIPIDDLLDEIVEETVEELVIEDVMDAIQENPPPVLTPDQERDSQFFTRVLTDEAIKKEISTVLREELEVIEEEDDSTSSSYDPNSSASDNEDHNEQIAEMERLISRRYAEQGIEMPEQTKLNK